MSWSSTSPGATPQPPPSWGRGFSIIDKLAAGDFDGPEQELTSGERVRSWAVPPVRVYYQRQEDALWVLRIYHQARRPIAR